MKLQSRLKIVRKTLFKEHCIKFRFKSSQGIADLDVVWKVFP